MSVRTISEKLFEDHCASRGILIARIPENGMKVADFSLTLPSGQMVAEIKQLDPNKDDLARMSAPPGSFFGPVLAPARRVRGLLADAYRQVRQYGAAGTPALVVCYNNAGFLRRIDNYTVTRAMLGGTAVKIALDQAGVIRHVGQQFTGGRTVTRNTCRAISAVCVLTAVATDRTELVAYHNPYASNPIDPSMLSPLADAQFAYEADPHLDHFTQLLAQRLEV